MSIRRIFQPLIMSTKPDGTVEYKPLTTSDDADASVTNIFLPKEEEEKKAQGGYKASAGRSTRA